MVKGLILGINYCLLQT